MLSADSSALVWRKSSFSESSNCVEVAIQGESVLIRDSKNRNWGILRVSSAAWQELTQDIKAKLADLDERVKDIDKRQGEINTQLARLDERVKAIPDQEQRIRRLEVSRAKLIGAMVAVSTIASSLGTWLGMILSNH